MLSSSVQTPKINFIDEALFFLHGFLCILKKNTLSPVLHVNWDSWLLQLFLLTLCCGKSIILLPQPFFLSLFIIEQQKNYQPESVCMYMYMPYFALMSAKWSHKLHFFRKPIKIYFYTVWRFQEYKGTPGLCGLSIPYSTTLILIDFKFKWTSWTLRIGGRLFKRKQMASFS